jgi:hypothetical protein
LNQLILSVIKNSRSTEYLAFGIDSFSAISDCGASFSATPFMEDFIARSYKLLSGVTISDIALDLVASGIGTVNYKIKDDKGNFLNL